MCNNMKTSKSLIMRTVKYAEGYILCKIISIVLKHMKQRIFCLLLFQNLKELGGWQTRLGQLLILGKNDWVHVA